MITIHTRWRGNWFSCMNRTGFRDEMVVLENISQARIHPLVPPNMEIRYHSIDSLWKGKARKVGEGKEK